MKTWKTIVIAFCMLLAGLGPVQSQGPTTSVDFFGVAVAVPVCHTPADYGKELSGPKLAAYVAAMDTASLKPYLDVLTGYKKVYRPDDWLYYQLVRKLAQTLSPKEKNYYQYTIYKWWFLTRSGYDARLAIADTFLLFYVQSNENIYNVPSRTMQGRQYVCLNYHDYGTIDFDRYHFSDATPYIQAAGASFSYKINHLPDFRQTDYTEKEVAFSDGLNEYSFRIKINPQVKQLFNNYPVVDYALQFNMPLSRPTYESLVPALKKQLKGMKARDGVAFLMQFTRYAFSFKPDKEVFGGEKRLSAEQTLLYDYSDCEDRSALFFFLVKEMYNLPMLVLTYPEHVTVAVAFEKPYGKTILFEGQKYAVCEPSPQRIDLGVGQLLPELQKQAYQVAYAYRPK